MALVNLRASAIAVINIESIGGSNPSPTTVLTCAVNEVLIVNVILAVCKSAVQNSSVSAKVDRTAGSTFTGYIAYKTPLRRNSPPLNLLLGKELYLAENETLTLITETGGDWDYVVSYARVTN